MIRHLPPHTTTTTIIPTEEITTIDTTSEVTYNKQFV